MRTFLTCCAEKQTDTQTNGAENPPPPRATVVVVGENVTKVISVTSIESCLDVLTADELLTVQMAADRENSSANAAPHDDRREEKN